MNSRFEVLKTLFKKPSPNEDSLFTSITRPLSFWVVLISFIVLVFLDSFKIISDSTSLIYLKEVLLVLIGIYFAGRSAEKIIKNKSTQNAQNAQNTQNDINHIRKTNEFLKENKKLINDEEIRFKKSDIY